MSSRSKVYFVADVHLGLDVNDPSGRERRFVAFLKSIRTPQTCALYLLGDIWDFWYEYRDVVPRCGQRVVSELIQLMDEGVVVYFMPGNHDIWCYSYFESLGMKKIQQPFICTIGDKRFCLGHGDGLGKSTLGFRVVQSVFHNRVAQILFSLLHPWIAFRFGNMWSKGNRGTHKPYSFDSDDEPLVRFSRSFMRDNGHVDYFLYGHYHASADIPIGVNSRVIVIEDWIGGTNPYAVYDLETGDLTSSFYQIS